MMPHRGELDKRRALAPWIQTVAEPSHTEAGPRTGSSIGWANLRPPWQPGQSGNPKGKNKSRVIRALLEPHSRTCVARLLSIMRSKNDKNAIEALKVIFTFIDGSRDTISEVSDEMLVRELERRANELKAKMAAA